MEEQSNSPRYPAYPRYKDSGIDWLGQVPEGWETRRLKYLSKTKLRYGANESGVAYDKALPRYIRITDFSHDGKLSGKGKLSLTFAQSEGYYLEDGDILFARSGATVGKSYQFRKRMEREDHYAFAGYLIKCSPDENIILSDYLFYYTNSIVFNKWKDSVFSKATIENIGADKYSNLSVPFPSLQLQYSIIAFLDKKVAQIDRAVAQKEELITLLQERRQVLIQQAVTRGLDPDAPLKDSGIDWIGEIPAHWEVMNLRYAFKFLDSKRVPLSSVDRESRTGPYPYYGASGIIDYVDDYLFDEELILIAEDGANLLSKSTPLAFVASGKFWVNNHAHVLKPKFTGFKYWAELLSLIDYTTSITGAAQPKLSRENLGSIKVIVPTSGEITQISEYVDEVSLKVKKAIALQQEQIARLREYKTVLIDEAVTGKIKVS